jgi:hypothetical protein
MARQLTELNNQPIDRINTNAKHWQPIPNENVQKYSALLHAFAQAVLLTLDGHPSGYSFPINSGTKAAGKLLLAELDKPHSDEQTLELVHQFIYPFLAARDIVGEYNKWDEVVECFLAIYCLEQDGNFRSAKNTTQLLAILKYLCRGSTLVEATLQAAREGKDPLK